MLGRIQSMTERVPRNGVPTFYQKERNGAIRKERNEERNGVPAFGGTRGKTIFLENLCINWPKTGIISQTLMVFDKTPLNQLLILYLGNKQRDCRPL